MGLKEGERAAIIKLGLYVREYQGTIIIGFRLILHHLNCHTIIITIIAGCAY